MSIFARRMTFFSFYQSKHKNFHRESFVFGENTSIKKNKDKVICSVNEESKQTVPVSKLNAAFFNTCQASTCLLIRHLAAFRPY